MNRIRRPDGGVVFTQAFTPPASAATERLCLVPLGPAVAEYDYVAIMGSRERLRRELRWGDWPPEGFTLEDNVADLAGHLEEFERREAYAYSVLDPSKAACLGCLYLEPWDPGAQLALWVTDAEVSTGLEVHLLQELQRWLATWPLPSVRVPVRATNPRLVATLVALGCPEVPGPDDHRSFLLLGTA